MLIRQKLVTAELAAASENIHEIGGNNRGPWVDQFLKECGLPAGYAWCDAFQSYEEHAVAGKRLAVESASVGATWAEAVKLGWTVKRPLRGDLVCYDFDGDGQLDDHIGCVVKVLHLPGTKGKDFGFYLLRTVEGNTSSGSGSQSDGDGVYIRTRLVRPSTVGFIRIPGYAPASTPANPTKGSPHPA